MQENENQYHLAAAIESLAEVREGANNVELAQARQETRVDEVAQEVEVNFWITIKNKF